MLKILQNSLANTFGRRLQQILLCPLLMIICSCSSIFDSRSQKESLMQEYESSSLGAAVATADDKAEEHADTGDDLMWRYEEGTINFIAGNYQKSLEAFSHAEKIVNNFENRAELNVRAGTAEAGAVLINQNTLPYQSNYAEKIVLNAYKALDYFAQGNSEGARVELNRMRYRQKNAAEEFADEIENAQKELDNKPNIDTKQVAGTITELKQIDQALKKHSNKAYGNFMNPFASYLSAIGYLSSGNLNEALVDFRDIYNMDKSNKLVQRDYISCAKQLGDTQLPAELAGIKPLPYPLEKDIVFVIFANGVVAAKKSFNIHLVLPPPIGYTGVAFPVLEYFPKPLDRIVIRNNTGDATETMTVANMDAIISEEYKKALPLMITRTILNVAAKETANYFAIKQAKEKGDLAWILAMLTSSAYKYAFNTADTRCWQTLPKEYQIAHMPKPKDGVLYVKAMTSGTCLREEKLTLSSGYNMTIVFVQAPSSDAIFVRVFEFN